MRLSRCWLAVAVALLVQLPTTAHADEFEFGVGAGGLFGGYYYIADIDGRHPDYAVGEDYPFSPTLSVLADAGLSRYFEFGFRADFTSPVKAGSGGLIREHFAHFRALAGPTLRVASREFEFEVGLEGGVHLVHFWSNDTTVEVDNPVGIGWTVGPRLAGLLRFGAGREWAAGLEVRNLFERGGWNSDGCCATALTVGSVGLKLMRRL